MTGEPDTIATMAISKVDAESDKKSEKYKRSKQENNNSKPVTLNHLTSKAELCTSVATEIVLPQKGHDLRAPFFLKFAEFPYPSPHFLPF